MIAVLDQRESVVSILVSGRLSPTVWLLLPGPVGVLILHVPGQVVSSGGNTTLQSAAGAGEGAVDRARAFTLWWVEVLDKKTGGA